MLSPSWLIDRLLDHIERLGEELVPAPAGRSPREPVAIEANLEPISV